MLAVLVMVCVLHADVPHGTEVLRSLPAQSRIGIAAGKTDGVQIDDRIAVWRDHVMIATGVVTLTGERTAICTIVWRTGTDFPRVGDLVYPLSYRPPAKEPPAPPERTPPAPPERTPPAPPAKAPPAAPDETPPTPRDAPPAPAVEPSPRTVKVPSLEAIPEEPIAVGVLGRRIFVSSTDGVYTFAGSDRRFSTAVLPHTILRFVPWGERLWGETHGGVLLWDDGAWHRHPWSSKVADQDHAFARVATFKDLAWGSFGRQILQWDPRSRNVILEDGRPRVTYGLWVPVGLPFQEEIESVLALSETTLILGTAAGRIHRREGSATRLLGELPGVNGDPLLLDLARDADGVIWGLAVEGARLARIDSEGLQVVPRGAPGEEDALPQGTLLRLMADPRGRIAVLSEDHGVFRLEGAAWTCIAAAPGERAIDMTFQEDAVVLLTQRRLLRVQGQSREELFVFAPEEPPEPGAP